MNGLRFDLEEADNFSKASLNDEGEPCNEFLLLIGRTELLKAADNTAKDRRKLSKRIFESRGCHNLSHHYGVLDYADHKVDGFDERGGLIVGPEFGSDLPFCIVRVIIDQELPDRLPKGLHIVIVEDYVAILFIATNKGFPVVLERLQEYILNSRKVNSIGVCSILNSISKSIFLFFL